MFAATYLRPVADAIAAQLQAAVSICIIGPVANHGGEVEVRRYAHYAVYHMPYLMIVS